MNDAAREFEQALAFHEQGETDAARACLLDATAADPDHGRAWELLGILHWSAGEWGFALRALETASALVPLSCCGQCALADTYRATERPELAMLGFRALLVRRGVDAQVLLKCAYGLHRLDRTGVALQAARRAATVDPDCAQAYYDGGFYMARLGYSDSAVEAMARRAVALEPDHVEYRVGLASFLDQLERSRDAYDVVRPFTLRQIADIRCDCCLERIADLFQRMGDTEREAACHRRLHELASRTDSDPEETGECP